MNRPSSLFKTGETNVDRQTLASEETVQVLTHQEIDRRIGDVAARIVAAPVDEASGPADGPLEPRWITAAELVRRMEPFMVLN